MFMAKDGFLLYYGEKSNPKATHFDTKPKVRQLVLRTGAPTRVTCAGASGGSSLIFFGGSSVVVVTRCSITVHHLCLFRV